MNTRGRALIVDDNQESRIFLSALLGRACCQVEQAGSAEEALELLDRADFDLLVTDLMMPGMNGIELMEEVKLRLPSIDALIVTGYASISSAIDAIKRGAFSYLVKPIEVEEALVTIDRIFESRAIRAENVALKEELASADAFEKLIGQTRPMKEIHRVIDRVAPSSATVLITGESGVGKELIAKAIHAKSARSNGPFIKVSCAALPDTLIEAELFGHERGAFTGAQAMKKGRFELADKGTLFLDEIGEISLNAQVKLLRALQEKSFERLGGTKTINSDARFLAATNRDLKEEVRAGRFREDLFYRLNVIEIKAPPLREKKEDIAPLAYHFLAKYKKETGKKIDEISEPFLAALKEYHWPGNARELENIIERAVVLAQGKELDLSCAPETMKDRARLRARAIGTRSGAIEITDSSELKPMREARRAWERSYIERALKLSRFNVTRAAERLLIARAHLQRKIKEYRIDSKGVDQGD